MKMKNGLPGARIHVENSAVSLLVNPKLLGNLLGSCKDVLKERTVLGQCVIQRRDVKTRTDQHVNRSLRADVLERKNEVVFIDLLRRRFAGNDLAE